MSSSNEQQQNGVTRVVNVRGKDYFDVYIGRPSFWGNPFVLRRESERAVVIKQYKQWVEDHPEMLERLPELRGKRLGCYCAPKPCHGDALIELLNKHYPR